MSINQRGAERRRKRMGIPILYFMAEIVLAWLVLSLIQMKFDVTEWSVWAIGLFILGLLYSIAKTVNIFQRQKDYVDAEDEI